MGDQLDTADEQMVLAGRKAAELLDALAPEQEWETERALVVANAVMVARGALGEHGDHRGLMLMTSGLLSEARELLGTFNTAGLTHQQNMHRLAACLHLSTAALAITLALRS